MEFGNEFNDSPVTLPSLSTLPHIDLLVPHQQANDLLNAAAVCTFAEKFPLLLFVG